MDDEQINEQYDLLSERLDHYRERIDALEDEKDQRSITAHNRRGHALEVIIILLVALESVFTVLLYFHHA
jgi:uncharacterized Rmd1/YagE family protein